MQTSPVTRSPPVARPAQPTVEDIPATTPPPHVKEVGTAAEPAEVAAPSISDPEPPNSAGESSVPVLTSSYSHIGTIDTTESQLHSTSSTNLIPQWVIWSRRPHNPSQAPGIIISSQARPPPKVVQQALDLKTPPASRSPTPFSEPVVTAVSLDDAAIAWSSQTDSTVPSSVATESTNTPTIPGSPVSSHTSISVTGTPAKDAPEVPIGLSEAAVTLISTVSTSTAIGSISTSTTSETAATPIAAESTVLNSTPEIPPSSSDVAVPPQPPQPPQAVDTSAPPVTIPKKSWASLLRQSSEELPGPSRNALPTSSVVGFSIPATTNGNSSVPVSASHMSELLTLLTTGPAPVASGYSAAAAAASGSGSVMKIRPRGLVNSGNMCFANSVLQMLLYCPPFYKLFAELGKLLVDVDNNTRKEDVTTTNGKATTSGSTPLVLATSLFLQEFMDVNERKKMSSKKVDVARNGINGSSGSGAKGKGKEKAFRDERQEVDDWDGESFLPSYVYDAMKTKKRFDTMRVYILSYFACDVDH